MLVGDTAHDFNNLLTGILGKAGPALMKLSPASVVRGNLREIEMASQRAAELCSQMLAYSGKGRFVVEAVNINDVMEEITHRRQSMTRAALSPSPPARWNTTRPT